MLAFYILNEGKNKPKNAAFDAVTVGTDPAKKSAALDRLLHLKKCETKILVLCIDTHR